MTEAMGHGDRVWAAIKLKPVDRVPVMPLVDVMFPSLYKGMTLAEGIGNYSRGFQAMLDVFEEVGGWDGMILPSYSLPLLPTIGSAVAPALRKLPGRELPPDYIPQYDEREVLSVEDYDRIIELGWNRFAEKYTEKLNPYPPEKIISWARRQTEQYVRDIKAWEQRGVISLVGAIVDSPLMFFSIKRTFKEFIKDVYRIPDKVQAAMDAVVEDFIRNTIETAELTGVPGVMLILERGGGFYFPLRIFERFEFPYIKRMVEAFAARGLLTVLHLDQDWTLNLPYFKELPGGMCICELDGTTDIFKAKEVLGGHLCLMGDVPASLLSIGSSEEVEEYCRKLIETVGRGAGFILSSGCTVPADCKFENFKTMVDSVKKYPPPPT